MHRPGNFILVAVKWVMRSKLNTDAKIVTIEIGLVALPCDLIPMRSRSAMCSRP